MATMNHLPLLLLLAVTAVGFTTVRAESVSLDHIVGGRLGWRLPPNKTFYEEWARNRTFVVGDKLVFMYTPALQNVLEVPEKDFHDCTEQHVINMYYAGPTVLQINKSGPHYYYCSIGVHCEGGQKLFINVSATPVPDPARDGLPAEGPGLEITGKLDGTATSGGDGLVGVFTGLLLAGMVSLFV